MPGVIKRPNQTVEVGAEKPDVHTVLLRLENDDRDKLQLLCRLGDTNQSDILRQCLRHVHDVEMAELRKGGAA